MWCNVNRTLSQALETMFNYRPYRKIIMFFICLKRIILIHLYNRTYFLRTTSSSYMIPNHPSKNTTRAGARAESDYWRYLPDQQVLTVVSEVLCESSGKPCIISLSGFLNLSLILLRVLFSLGKWDQQIFISQER